MKIHIVKKGDSLYLIAKKYNVSLDEVVKLNPSITNPDVLEVGTKVKVPTWKPVQVDVMHQHVVKQGDTLWKLSKAWGIPLSDMIKANPHLKNPNVLLTGEVVNVPKPGTPIVVPENVEHSHGGNGHHPLHPLSVVHGVTDLVGKVGKLPAEILPSIPFLGGKKSTAPIEGKANTAPIEGKVDTAPMPTPVPEPIPEEPPVAELPAEEAPVAELPPVVEEPPVAEELPVEMPPVVVVEKPVVKPGYSINIEYEKSTDLFEQYGIPATEVMSLYDMPALPESIHHTKHEHHHGYGVAQPVQGGYGYGGQPELFSPAEEADCPPGHVGGANDLPWGAPVPITPPSPYGASPSDHGGPGYGYGATPAGIGPFGYEPAEISPHVAPQAGYGYGHEAAQTLPAHLGPQGGYGYGHEAPQTLPSHLGPQGGYGYGHEAPQTLPAHLGPQGGYGYGHEAAQTLPADLGHQGGYGYGYEAPQTLPSHLGPQGGYGYGHEAAQTLPADLGPQGGYGYGYEAAQTLPADLGPQGGYGYGYETPQTLPADLGPQGGYGYGYDAPQAMPAHHAPHGGYGYGPGAPQTLPANFGPQGGYGYGPGSGPLHLNDYGYGHETAGVSNYGHWGVPTYGYSGYGQTSPLQQIEAADKSGDCGCGDGREKEVAFDDEPDLKIELPHAGKKTVVPRKPAKKTTVRTVRAPRASQPRRTGPSLPWINR
ncbi:LysM peptidoglycan-binding domain-containing protein [Paenibacillus methanolicus]|uniref:LysM repeat protein n=1 Tax=Paenibacillus methanolicus TaxID=582686 RepID=A0A5S5C3E8_9BACL|nr:LysM peptidoglycan-binding domain-containing protein [Paenibacillus methanolicus]TYP73837.1 LysM repeat protein [Paenibacillus methanolicus]